MLNFIVVIMVFLISIIFVYKTYTSCKETYEIIIFILMYLVFLSPLVVFYLDLYNIPSLLGYNGKVDTQGWLSFIMNYLGTIISSIISVVFLVYMTMYQIKKNNEDNIENHRIQNMPLLKYEITTDYKECLTNEKYLISSKFSKEVNSRYNLYLNIKNIGLNSVKKICIELESEFISESKWLIDGKSQISIEKNETIEVYRYFALNSDSNYKMNLNIYYEDVLNNWYLQRIEIDYITTNIHNGNQSVANVIFNVNEEIKLGKENNYIE